MADKVAAIWVLHPNGSALLQHRDNKPDLRHANMWVPPGGHADPGESISDCAYRELCEETEYVASNLQLLASYDRTYEDGSPYNVTYFWCWYDGVQTIVCHEGQEMAFIARQDALNYQIPTHLFELWDAAVAAATTNPKVLKPKS